jgi:hypothetical protein
MTTYETSQATAADSAVEIRFRAGQPSWPVFVPDELATEFISLSHFDRVSEVAPTWAHRPLTFI